MKLLSEAILSRFVTSSDWAEASVVYIHGAGITDCTLVDCPATFFEASIIHLAGNQLSDAMCSIWKTFPSAWWVDLSHNSITSFASADAPAALGFLDLTGNTFSMAELANLASSHILRINITSSSSLSDICELCTVLPLAWCCNDEFITGADRRKARQVTGDQAVTRSMQRNWRPMRSCARESVLLTVSHHLAHADSITDTWKLDILLEDYLCNALVFNAFASSVSNENNSSVKRVRALPLPPALPALFCLEHRQRLDLSVLLTASILFELPDHLFSDACALLLPGCPRGLVALPAFARTALVSLLRRISRKEQQDLLAYNRLRRKSSTGAPLQHGVCSYEGPEGFAHLQAIKAFLADSSEPSDTCPLPVTPFSELEQEILAKLPDCPTRLSASADGSSNRYTPWVAFTARHAVFLLSKCPACPRLTGPATSISEQDAYLRLLPILTAAEMSLADLDIATSGPAVDGRDIKNMARIAGVSKPGPGASKHAQQLSAAMEALGPGFLPFGLGLPKGGMGSLRWKNEDFQLPRDYPRPWVMQAEEAAEAAGNQKAFFLTEEEPSGRAGPTVRAEVYRLDVNTSEAALAVPLNPFDMTVRNGASPTHAPAPWSPSLTRSPAASPVPVKRAVSTDDHTPIDADAFPAQFRPHSRSSSDLRMVYPPPMLALSRPASQGSMAKSLHSKPSTAPAPLGRDRDRDRDGDGIDMDDSTVAQRSMSVVSISLPSVDRDRCSSPAEDPHLMLTQRTATPEPERAPSRSAMLPPLQIGETRSRLLMDERSSVTSEDEDIAALADSLALISKAIETHDPQPAPLSVPRPASAPSPIRAYTADTLWAANFLLAPADAVQTYNARFRDLNLTGDPASDMSSYWRSMAEPPVVLLGQQSPYAKRLAQATLLQATIPSVQPAVHAQSIEHRPPSPSPPHHHHPPAVQQHHHHQQDDAISIDDSILSESARAARLSASKESSSLTHHHKHHAVSLLGNQTSKRNKKLLMPVQQLKRTQQLSAADRLTAADRDHLQAAGQQLMRSMGTLRNMRELDNFNQHIPRSSASKLLPVMRIVPSSSSMKHLVPAAAGAVGDDTAQHRVPETVHRSAADADYDMAEDQEGSGVFLTGTGAVHEHDDMDALTMDTEDEHQGPVQLGATPFIGRQPPPAMLMHPWTPAEQMRMEHGYEHIYSLRDWEEPAAVTHSGAHLVPAFHPLLPKTVYAVDQAHSHSALNACASAPAAPARAVPHHQPMPVTPTLITPAPAAATYNTAVYTSSIPAPAPMPLSSVDTNLQVIRSNKFLQKHLLLQVRLQRPAPAPVASPSSSIGREDEDMVSMSSSMSASVERSSLIYEAYQSQIQSGSPDLPTPSLLMEHSLTQSRHISSSKKTKSKLMMPVSPLPAGPAALPSPSSHHHHSQPQAQGIMLQPSSKHHRAATHKLSLNRSFRMKLPSLHRGAPSDLLLVASFAAGSTTL